MCVYMDTWNNIKQSMITIGNQSLWLLLVIKVNILYFCTFIYDFFNFLIFLFAFITTVLIVHISLYIILHF